MIDKAPERIWASYDEEQDDAVWSAFGPDEVTWEKPPTEYTRTDLHDAVVAERDRLRYALRQIVGTAPWADPDMGFNELARDALKGSTE